MVRPSAFAYDLYENCAILKPEDVGGAGLGALAVLGGVPGLAG